MTDGNIIDFPQPFFGELNPNEVLDVLSKEENIKDFFAIIMRDDGSFTYHSNYRDANIILWWLETCKMKLLKGDFS